MEDSRKALANAKDLPSESQTSVLLVDDNPANLLALHALLDDLGHNLVEARSGEEALAQMKIAEFAVVLLDVIMPGIGGFETAKQIRQNDRFRRTPIIFLTASDIDGLKIEEAYALGAVDLLVKPLLPVILRAKVQGFVELFEDKQAARREAEQLRLLVQGTTEFAIFMLDPEGRVLTWNSGAERLKGYKAEEIIGRHFSRFYPPAAIETDWPKHELEIARTEGCLEDEGWRVRKDGTQFWANVVITALRDEQGNLRGFSKVTRDMTGRKKADEALRRSEERFRLLVEEVKDYAIFLLNPQGYVVTWNAGAERIKQYRADEIIGQHFSRFYPQEAIDRDWPADELKIATKEGRFEDEGWRVRKDGTQFWANVVITALRDEAGNHLGFSKITRDMTERKQADENARMLLQEEVARRTAEESAEVIREQREQLRVTLHSIGDGVIAIDAEGRIKLLNSVAQALTGWTPEEASGMPLPDVFRLFNEQTRQPVENPALRVLKDGVQVGLANHTVLIAKDGNERSIDDSAAPIRGESGATIGAVLVFRDVTERRRAEEDLRRSEAELSDFFENATIGLHWVGADGTILRANRAELEMLGYSREEYVGHPIAEFHADEEAICEILRRLKTGEKLEEYPARLRCKDGSLKDVVIDSSVLWKDGDFAHTRCFTRDVTERKRMVDELRQQAEQLRETDRRKDEFLATLAHELRNPLAPIRNSLQILKMPRVDAETAQHTRDMMERQVHHLVRLVDDLLDVSRVMRSKIELRKEPVELATIAARAVETAKPSIEFQGHRLTISVPHESLLLDADPTRLVQVVGNLLTNSAKYTEANGNIWLTANREGDQAVLRVKDDGIGIAPDMLSHVFELFVQADHASTKAQGGLGIGLTLVKNLVEMHGGSVEAHSEGLSKGCEFVVRLPLLIQKTQQTGDNESVETDRSTPLSGHRLLVVDDNHDAAITLSMLLRLHGHEVRVAHDGLAALEVATTFRPDMIFLDIGMPGMDGYEVARRMRKIPGLEKIVLAALTGWGQQEDRRRTAEAGFDHHLVKPPEPKVVDTLLADLKLLKR